jgi:hypothetical protein
MAMDVLGVCLLGMTKLVKRNQFTEGSKNAGYMKNGMRLSKLISFFVPELP